MHFDRSRGHGLFDVRDVWNIEDKSKKALDNNPAKYRTKRLGDGAYQENTMRVVIGMKDAELQVRSMMRENG